MEDVLNPKQFYRANRQYIVNFHAIQGFKTQTNQKINLLLKSPLNKEEIDISREKAQSFRKWFEAG